MDKLRALVRYTDDFRAELRRLDAYDGTAPAGQFTRLARLWMETGTSAAEAAEWTTLLVLPDEVDAARTYHAAYTAHASQLAGRDLAMEWRRRGVPAEQAGAWASLGYTPEEAERHIAEGITPEMVRTGEEIGQDIAGGSDIHAAEVIDRMIREGTIVDPALVSRIKDPTDPDVEIIAVRDE